MPIDLYQIEASPPCRAVMMTAQHIGVELNKIRVDLFAGEQLKPEFLKLNPQHTVPTIDDDGFILWESRAIQTYLVDKYAPGNPIYPKDPQDRAVVDRMLYFDIGTLHKAQSLVTRPFLFKGQHPKPDLLEAYESAVKLLDEMLAKTPYAAGNHITLADFSIVATLTMAKVIDFSFEKYPRITAWMKKLSKEIPSFNEINIEPMQQLIETLKSRK